MACMMTSVGPEIVASYDNSKSCYHVAGLIQIKEYAAKGTVGDVLIARRPGSLSTLQSKRKMR
jgi:hypothetical protein